MTVMRCTLAPTGAAAEAAAMHRGSVPVLETERLRLRASEMADYPAYVEIFRADQGFMGGPFTDQQIWQDFTNYVAGWMLHGHGLWSVDTKDGVLVGFINLGLEWGDEEPELGWLILKAHRGQGYATEAADAARRYGRTLVSSIVSYVDPMNDASNRVAERLGATRDAEAEARILKTYGDAEHVWRHGDAV
ncbi:MAG: GNAT family N-acetyltransferase [Pseudomonadota bacterium]